MAEESLAKHVRDVGQVEGCGWRKDVLEVLGAGLLEAMERRVGVVLSQSLVVQPVPRQRHRLVLGQRHADDLAIHLLAIEVAHRWGQMNPKRLKEHKRGTITNVLLEAIRDAHPTEPGWRPTSG